MIRYLTPVWRKIECGYSIGDEIREIVSYIYTPKFREQYTNKGQTDFLSKKDTNLTERFPEKSSFKLGY